MVTHLSLASLRLFLIAVLRVFLRCMAPTSVAVRSRLAERCVDIIVECSSSAVSEEFVCNDIFQKETRDVGAGLVSCGATVSLVTMCHVRSVGQRRAAHGHFYYG